MGIFHLPVYTFCHFEQSEKSLSIWFIRFLVVSLLEMTMDSVNYFLSVMKDAVKCQRHMIRSNQTNMQHEISHGLRYQKQLSLEHVGVRDLGKCIVMCS